MQKKQNKTEKPKHFHTTGEQKKCESVYSKVSWKNFTDSKSYEQKIQTQK